MLVVSFPDHFWTGNEANVQGVISSPTMIEVRAELLGLGVYLDGEWVTCTITFTNQGSTEETIAWAGAQLHCQFYCREDIVRVSCDQHPLPSPANDTAFIPNKGMRG